MRERVQVDAVGGGDDRGWSPGSLRTIERLAEVRCRRAAASANFDGELAEHGVRAALADQTERGDVPEHRRAPVAEQDLPARRAAPNRSVSPDRIEPTRLRTGAWRWLVPSSVAPGRGQCGELFWAHFRRAATEPSVGRQQVQRGSKWSVGRALSLCQHGSYEFDFPTAFLVAAPVADPCVGSAWRSINESATLAVDAKAKALQAQGENVIGFGAGEPDFPTPDHIVEAAVTRLSRPEEPPLHARPPACPRCARRSLPRPSATAASRPPPARCS